MNPKFDALALLPEIILVATLAVVFIADLVVSEARKAWTFTLSAGGTIASLVAVVALLGAHHHSALMANNTYVVDGFSLVAKGIVLACTLTVLVMGMPRTWKGEYCVMLLTSVVGMFLVVSARDILLFFVAFELFAVPGYLLVGWNKRSTHGHEGLLKYYLLGIISTAVLLYGISLLYGFANSTSFSQIAGALSGGAQDVALARIAVFFVIVGMAFKISAVPFHFWAPDAYQAAPIPVAAFLSAATKAAGLLALIEVTLLAVPFSDDVWGPLLWVLAVVTMTAGNLLALRQTELIRMLAYSSIAQAGFLLIPLAVTGYFGGDAGRNVQSTFEYLMIYAVSNLAAFASVAYMAHSSGTTLADLPSLARRSPAVAVALSISLLSLAGIPPLGGWFAKVVVFQSGINAHTAWAVALVAIAAANAAIGLVYYARPLRYLWLDRTLVSADTNPVITRSADLRGLLFVLGVTGALIVVSGVLPGLITYLGGFSSLVK